MTLEGMLIDTSRAIAHAKIVISNVTEKEVGSLTVILDMDSCMAAHDVIINAYRLELDIVDRLKARTLAGKEVG